MTTHETDPELRRQPDFVSASASEPLDDVSGDVAINGVLKKEDTSWQDRANCLNVGPELFSPERGSSAKAAKGVCNACEVRMDCLEYALRNGEKNGIWGVV